MKLLTALSIIYELALESVVNTTVDKDNFKFGDDLQKETERQYEALNKIESLISGMKQGFI